MNLLGDHKAWRIQCFKHVREDVLYRCDALHLVEGVFELRVCGVELRNLRHVAGLQVFKKMHHALQRSFWGVRVGDVK